MQARNSNQLRPASDRWFQYGAIVPAICLLLALTIYPIVNLLLLGFSTVRFEQGQQLWSFTPAKNLAELFSDGFFANSLVITVIFAAVAVSIEVVAGLALALLVSGIPRAKGIVRTTMILPLLLPPVAVGSMWKLLYNYDFGLINQTLGVFGLGPVGWLSDTHIALISIIVTDVWHWTPFVFLILFASVEGLPTEVLEAARVDGARTWQTVCYVILPLMAPAIAVATLFRSILSFNVFDEIYLLTSGGPSNATEVVSLHLYKVFFEQNDMGYGALLSLATILFIVLFIALSGRLVLGSRHAQP